jgi:hypothetical protein
MQFIMPQFDRETYEMLKLLKQRYFEKAPLQLSASMQNLHTITKAIHLLYETETGSSIVPGFEKIHQRKNGADLSKKECD